MTGVYPARLPHSEIPGSMLVCSSPGLIAAYRVLHRLLTPRHPPCALSSLTILNSKVYQCAWFDSQRFERLPYSVVKERTGTGPVLGKIYLKADDIRLRNLFLVLSEPFSMERFPGFTGATLSQDPHSYPSGSPPLTY